MYNVIYMYSISNFIKELLFEPLKEKNVREMFINIILHLRVNVKIMVEY